MSKQLHVEPDHKRETKRKTNRQTQIQIDRQREGERDSIQSTIVMRLQNTQKRKAKQLTERVESADFIFDIYTIQKFVPVSVALSVCVCMFV